MKKKPKQAVQQKVCVNPQEAWVQEFMKAVDARAAKKVWQHLEKMHLKVSKRKKKHQE